MAKTVALVVAQKDFRDEELQSLLEVFQSRRVAVKVLAKTRHKAIGRFGLEVKPDLALGELNLDDFDALVFIGGTGAHQYFDDTAVFKIINDFKKSGKVLGACCLAVSILANAGALIGKQATAFPTEEENLKNKGADYTGMPNEIDGKIATAKDPVDAKRLGEDVAYLLAV